VGEVDQLNDAVHHRVPQGDEGVDRAKGQGVHKLVDAQHGEGEREEEGNDARQTKGANEATRA
jgi:hypothetical protein